MPDADGVVLCECNRNCPYFFKWRSDDKNPDCAHRIRSLILLCYGMPERSRNKAGGGTGGQRRAGRQKSRIQILFQNCGNLICMLAAIFDYLLSGDNTV